MDKPEALQLADAIDPLTRRNLDNLTCAAAAAELRRLSAVEAQRDALLEALRWTARALDHDHPAAVKARAAIKAVEEGK